MLYFGKLLQPETHVGTVIPVSYMPEDYILRSYYPDHVIEGFHKQYKRCSEVLAVDSKLIPQEYVRYKTTLYDWYMTNVGEGNDLSQLYLDYFLAMLAGTRERLRTYMAKIPQNHHMTFVDNYPETCLMSPSNVYDKLFKEIFPDKYAGVRNVLPFNGSAQVSEGDDINFGGKSYRVISEQDYSSLDTPCYNLKRGSQKFYFSILPEFNSSPTWIATERGNLKKPQAQRMSWAKDASKRRHIDINTEERLWVYDVEVYPNYFCVTFENINSDGDREIKSFAVYTDQKGYVVDDRKDLYDFVNKDRIVLVGYNNLHYDDVILNWILSDGMEVKDAETFTYRTFFVSYAIINFPFDGGSLGKLHDILGFNATPGVINFGDYWYDENGSTFDYKDQKKFINRYKYWRDSPFKSIDLMKIMAFDKLGVSLKQVAIALRLPLVQDLPYSWDKWVNKEEAEEILSYNSNDTLITVALFNAIKKDILLRQDVSAMYRVNCMNRSQSTMANAILDSIYSKESGIRKEDFVDLRTERNTVSVKDCIPKVEFKSDIGKTLIELLTSLRVSNNNNFRYSGEYIVLARDKFEKHAVPLKGDKFKEGKSVTLPTKIDGVKYGTTKHKSYKVKILNYGAVVLYRKAEKKADKRIIHIHIGGKIFDMGSGGLHSQDAPGIASSNDNMMVVDADVASFYPNIMLNNGIKPEHLGDLFLDVLRKITGERLKAKKAAKDRSLSDKERSTAKTKADSLKITINSIFGKLGSMFYWLLDPKALLQVTIGGQLYLMSLIEELIQAGIKVISANTDGIVCEILREDQLEIYAEICDRWSKATDFQLEFTEYSRYIRRDVNNYITVKTREWGDCTHFRENLPFKYEGKVAGVKEKGCFETSINVSSAFYKLDDKPEGVNSPLQYEEWLAHNDPNNELVLTVPALNKGYKHPIVTKALRWWFLFGISPEVTVNGCDNVHEFFISEKSAKKFQAYITTIEDGKTLDTPIQRTNRFYVSSNGGTIWKRERGNEEGRVTRLIAGETLRIANNVDNPKCGYGTKYDTIKYSWYVRQAKDIINAIEPMDVQTSLLDLVA